MFKNAESIAFQKTPVNLEQFQRDGFIGPFPLLDKKEINLVLKACLANIPNPFLPNPLARHVAVKRMAELGSHQNIVNKITPVLGPDLLLWGSQVIKQKPSKKKRFHVDAEFSAIEGVSAWLGLKNVVSKKTFLLVAGSHNIKQSPQELNKQGGLDITDGDAVEEAAKKLNPACRLIRVDMKDGEFIIFHGRLWHGTENNTAKPRYAINFRYSTPSERVRLSKDGELPEAHWEEETPVCVMASGADHWKVNKTIKASEINKIKAILKGALYYFPKNLLKKFALKSRP